MLSLDFIVFLSGFIRIIWKPYKSILLNFQHECRGSFILMFLFTNAGVLSYLCSFSHFAWVGSKRGNLGVVFLRISYICALFIPFPLLLPHLIFDHVSCSSFLSRIPLLCLPTSFLAPLSWCWHSVRKGLGSRRYLVVLKLCSILSTRKQLYCSLSRKQKVQGGPSRTGRVTQ